MKDKDKPTRVSGDNLVDGKYSILDLVDIGKLRDIFEKFTQATGFTIGFLDHPGMNVLIATGWRDICTKFHRGCPVSAENCTKSNRHLLDQLDKPGKLVIEECENGMVDCATPIIIKGKHIASLATGQLLLREPDINRFKAQAKKFGYDEREYLEALKEIPVVSEEKLKVVTAFLGDIAVMISEMGYVALEIEGDAKRLKDEIVERKAVEGELRNMGLLHTAMLNSMYQFIGLMTPDGILKEANKTALDFIDCRPEEVRDMPFWETPWWRHSKEVQGLVRDSCKKAAKGEFVRFETTVIASDGHIIDIDFSVKPVRDEHNKVVFLIPEGRDITMRKDVDKAIQLYAKLLELTEHGLYRYDYEDGTILFANKGFVDILDLDCEPPDIFGKQLKDLLIYTEEPGMVRKAVNEKGEIRNFEYHFKTLKGDDRWVLHNSYSMQDPQTGRKMVEALVKNITDRKKAEVELEKYRQHLEELVKERTAQIEQTRDYLGKIINSVGNPIFVKDSKHRWILLNDAYCAFMGYKREELIGKTDLDFFPKEQVEVFWKKDEAVFASGGENINEEKFTDSKGAMHTILTKKVLYTDSGGEKLIVGIITDITDRKIMEERLRGTLLQLERSNKDLEQFAYISSHDLQEPLRMVASYLQLIEKRYKNRLDKDADEFIEFAVDGAKRMQQLINDLLDYSRVTTRGEALEIASCEDILDKVLMNLKCAIDENSAVITHDSLPLVKVDRTQLLQLFQNIIGNALKFHSGNPPRIRISCKREKDNWLFSVSDNGLGIDPQYHESIFVIFKRLHGRDEYPGTGVGLAICRKVVERHGGHIWVESGIGKGSTFYFTLPA